MLSPYTDLISCSYCNTEKHLQVVRISEPATAYLEKVVMPNQCIYFNAPAHASLEIYEGTLANSIYVDNIPCVQLRLPRIDSYVAKEQAYKHSKLTKVA